MKSKNMKTSQSNISEISNLTEESGDEAVSIFKFIVQFMERYSLNNFKIRMILQVLVVPQLQTTLPEVLHPLTKVLVKVNEAGKRSQK